jgi:hypothetical protein
VIVDSRRYFFNLNSRKSHFCKFFQSTFLDNGFKTLIDSLILLGRCLEIIALVSLSKRQDFISENFGFKVTFASNEISFASNNVHAFNLLKLCLNILKGVAVIEVKAKQKGFGT